MKINYTTLLKLPPRHTSNFVLCVCSKFDYLDSIICSRKCQGKNMNDDERIILFSLSLFFFLNHGVYDEL